jgi:hypothetical protein
VPDYWCLKREAMQYVNAHALHRLASPSRGLLLRQRHTRVDSGRMIPKWHPTPTSSPGPSWPAT